MSVNIAGLDKAEVLFALYNGSHAQGMSSMAVPGEGVSLERCREVIAGMGDRLSFDYFAGHVLKVDIGGDEFDPWLYDRDNYNGAAADVIAKLREEKN